MVSTLTTHCQWEDKTVRERTDNPPWYAEAKKMKSLTLHTHGCPRASLKDCSSSSCKLPRNLTISPFSGQLRVQCTYWPTWPMKTMFRWSFRRVAVFCTLGCFLGLLEADAEQAVGSVGSRSPEPPPSSKVLLFCEALSDHSSDEDQKQTLLPLSFGWQDQICHYYSYENLQRTQTWKD